MRLLNLALVAVLVAGIAAPASAASFATLSYDFTLTGRWFFGDRPSGTIVGLLGGLAVDGKYSGGTWTLNVYGHRFAAGTYECIRDCRFTGTELAGRPRAYAWGSPVPTWESSVQSSAGTFNRLFTSRYEWSALVASWAQANGLPPGLQTRLIVDAQMGM